MLSLAGAGGWGVRAQLCAAVAVTSVLWGRYLLHARQPLEHLQAKLSMSMNCISTSALKISLKILQENSSTIISAMFIHGPSSPKAIAVAETQDSGVLSGSGLHFDAKLQANV